MHMAAFKVDAADHNAPGAPTGLTATPASASRIDLGWTAATDDVGVAGYKVFRGATQVGDVTGTSYADTGLTDGTAYSYTVRAYDGAGNTSTPSNTATATTPDVSRPSVPGNVAAQAVSSSQVNVSWNASTDNVGVTGYKVFRDGTLVASPTGTTFQDTGRGAGTTYSYTVLARDAAGNESAPSPAATATTPAPDTSPPGASITAPVAGTVVSGSVSVSATATDNVAVAGVQFLLDGAALGSEDTTAPYSMTWDTTTAPNGTHTDPGPGARHRGQPRHLERLGHGHGVEHRTAAAPGPRRRLVLQRGQRQDRERRVGERKHRDGPGRPDLGAGQVRRGPASQWRRTT